MKLTTEYMQRYVGGQLEIINDNEGYHYRGQIKSVEVILGNQKSIIPDDLLHVEFDYCCKWNEGYKPSENKPFLKI